VRNRNGSFVSGLLVGVVAGLLTGAIGMAYSATGKKAWERFGDMFQAGYVSGFLDCVRVAKGMDSQGYVAANYVLPRGAKPTDYQVWINEEYKKPEAADRTLPQMLVLASHGMEAKFGPEQPIGNMQMQQMRKVIDARRQALIDEEKAKKAAEAAHSGEAPGTATAPAKPHAAPATPPGGTPPAEASPAK
jgi:cell division protein FtsN